MQIIDQIKFDDKGLIPAIAQDYRSGVVLMMAYMDKDALEKTISTGKAHYFSRSRGKPWLKGETSGHFQHVKRVLYDCDMDTILLKVDQTGVACHTGEPTCFYREIETTFGDQSSDPSILDKVYRIILQRKETPGERSYVSSLFSKGTDSILKKIGEEASELIISAKDGKKEDMVHETADLWFHTLVLLGQKGIQPSDVFSELQRRFGRSGIDEKESRK